MAANRFTQDLAYIYEDAIKDESDPEWDPVKDADEIDGDDDISDSEGESRQASNGKIEPLPKVDEKMVAAAYIRRRRRKFDRYKIFQYDWDRAARGKLNDEKGRQG